MSGAKVISYVDAVNAMARDGMREDLAQALGPILEVMTGVHGVTLALKARLDEANERIAALQARVTTLENDQPPGGAGRGMLRGLNG